MTEERISQNWPEGLKARVRKIVGGRGVTDFTVIAVLEKLSQVEAEQVDTPQTDTGAATLAATPSESGAVAGSIPADSPAPVSDSPSVADLREQLGMVTAAELPIPSTPRCDTCFSPLIDGECWTCDI